MQEQDLPGRGTSLGKLDEEGATQNMLLSGPINDNAPYGNGKDRKRRIFGKVNHDFCLGHVGFL